MMDNINVKQAIEDLALIRRVLEKSDSGREVDKRALHTTLMIQGATLIIVLCLLGIELIFGEPNKLAFLYSSSDSTAMLHGLITAGIGLLLLCVGMSFVVSKAASAENKDYNDFIVQNFSYLKRMSFYSDLLIKFIIFALVIYAKKPEWVPVLLTLFTADYLFQGRFFRLPLRIEILLAIATLAAAAWQFIYGISSLIPCLAIFSFITALSIGFTVAESKNKTEQPQ